MEKEIVLITGTSSGFGFLTALQLAQKGYLVVATMRNLGKRVALEAEAKKRKLEEHLEILELDVTNTDHIIRVKEYIETKFGRLDILINNAGYCAGGMTEHLSLDEWRKQLETNLFSVVAVTKAFLPLMREKRRGKIINIGSISGRFGFPAMGPYAASKWALSGFSESLRLEVLPFGIYVSLIEAGSFKTEIWDKSLEGVEVSGQDDYEKGIGFVYKYAKQSARDAADPSEVIHRILKICQTKRPKLRYQVGKGVRLQILSKALLPWSMIEKMILKKMR
ncbi:SDR family oxidoreductase [Anaerobacillus alkaliphilus]|uniref:SDR family oxidoreductase n=1 Tax=Anaerobacillus alkaliphilus TaxID=1548597 RepID=A0A4Q0VKL9_9BACI|nr:SDR family oxidoreductase [Anaerobacillus alkaliphilus]